MNAMKMFGSLAVVGVMGSVAMSQANADVIYSADFSVAEIGWTHTTSSPVPAAPQTAAGSNFTIGYDATPTTDSTSNWFKTLGGKISTSDWGGGAYFKSIAIDVSGYSDADISFIGSTIGSSVFNNAGVEFLEWNYSLDGGTPVTASTTSDGSVDHLFAGVDLTGVNTLVVGFAFNVDGAGDGFEFSSITVDATPLPEPASLALMSLGGLMCIRRR